VSSAIDEGTTPVRVVFRVDPGPLYHLDAVVVDVEPRPADLEVPSPAELGVPVGAPAESRLILDAEAALLAALEAQGHALAELRDRTALIDPAHASMELTLRADPGPKVHFGAIAITGLDQVDEAAVRRRLPWRQGAPITSEALEEGRKALRETGLFSGVRFELGTTPDAEGRVPVTVRLTERPHRSIDFGLRYRTDEGPGGDVRWTHRNFFGRGERVEARLDVSGIGGFLQGRFRKPDVWRRDLAFFAEGRLAYDDTDAFEAATIAARAGLEQRFAERTYLSGGPSFEIQKVDENATDLDDTYGLLSLPVRFDWDRSDDRLHPTRDGRMVVENEPFVDVFGNDLQFNRTRFDYAHYFLLVRDAPEIVLAGRTAIGTLFGEPLLDVPATKRFYAGGGGSVRGYGYQLAGKLGQGDDPIGGRSLLELSGEVRLRVTETIGGVVFVDAGTTYDGSVPDFGEPLRVGVGPGLRYFSPIGPVRVDLGFPIDRRNEDDPFQLYVSLGQAF
jgi:translocation and assembly module TamA